MNAYEHATVEDAAIQYAKALVHARNKGGNDPLTYTRYRGQTADEVLSARGITFGSPCWREAVDLTIKRGEEISTHTTIMRNLR